MSLQVKLSDTCNMNARTQGVVADEINWPRMYLVAAILAAIIGSVVGLI